MEFPAAAAAFFLALAVLLSTKGTGVLGACSYSRVTDSKTWDEATTACPAGYHLAMWSSQAEYEEIALELFMRGEHWIGLKNKGTHSCTNSGCDGKLMWQADGTDYVHGALDTPADIQGGGKECTKFNAGGADGEECDAQWPVLCQAGCNGPRCTDIGSSTITCENERRYQYLASGAYDIAACDSVGTPAKFHTEELFSDLLYVAETVLDEDLWTSLHRVDGSTADCEDAACDAHAEWHDGDAFSWDSAFHKETKLDDTSKLCIKFKKDEGKVHDETCSKSKTMVCSIEASCATPSDATFGTGGKYYKMFTDDKNYDNAQAACVADGGSLAMFKTEDDWDDVRGFYSGNNYWVGVQHIYHNTQQSQSRHPFSSVAPDCEWADGTAATSAPWTTDSSTIGIRINEDVDCVYMYQSNYLNDASCSGSKDYLCQYECGPSTDGAWSAWADTGDPCSTTCGGGTKPQSRACDNPAPAGGGADCPGSSTQDVACNTQDCPAWTTWTDWASCSLSCATGTQSRTRTCYDSNTSSNVADAACSADPSTDNQDCNTQACPVCSDPSAVANATPSPALVGGTHAEAAEITSSVRLEVGVEHRGRQSYETWLGYH